MYVTDKADIVTRFGFVISLHLTSKLYTCHTLIFYKQN